MATEKAILEIRLTEDLLNEPAAPPQLAGATPAPVPSLPVEPSEPPAPAPPPPQQQQTQTPTTTPTPAPSAPPPLSRQEREDVEALNGFRDDLKAGFGFVADILDRASARVEPPPVETRTRPETEQATPTTTPPPPPPPPTAPPATTPPPAPPPITGRTLLGPAANPEPFPVPGIAKQEGEPLDFGEEKPKPPTRPRVLDTEQPKRTTVLDMVPTPEPKRSTILDADLTPPAPKPTPGRNARLDLTPPPPERATILDVDLSPPKPKRNREVLDLTPPPEPIIPPGFEKDDQESTKRKPLKPARFFEDVPLPDEVKQFVEQAKQPRSKTKVDGGDVMDEWLSTKPQQPSGQREDGEDEETLPELEKHTKLLESVVEWLRRTQPNLFQGGKAGPSVKSVAQEFLDQLATEHPELFEKSSGTGPAKPGPASVTDPDATPTKSDPTLPKLEPVEDSKQGKGVGLKPWRADPNWSRPAQLPPPKQPERDAAWRAAQEHNNDPRGSVGRWLGMPKSSEDRNAPFLTRASSLASGIGSFGETARGIASSGGGNSFSGEMAGLAKGVSAAGDMLMKLGPVGMAAGAALNVAAAGAKAFSSVVDGLANRARELGNYNGMIAASSQLADVRGIMREMREASQLGGKYAELLSKQADLKDSFAEAMMPIKEAFLTFVNNVMPIINTVVKMIGTVFKTIQKGIEAIGGLKNLLNPIGLVKSVVGKIRDAIRGGTKEGVVEGNKELENERAAMQFAEQTWRDLFNPVGLNNDRPVLPVKPERAGPLIIPGM